MYSSYYLEPIYSSQKSFYKKAKVCDWQSLNILELVSYSTTVATFDKTTNILKIKGYYSKTTKRHILEFARQVLNNANITSKGLDLYLNYKEWEE